MSTERNKEKRLAFETLLDQGRVQIWLVRTVEWVDVPSSIAGRGPLGRIVALDYSKRFHMPNFKVTDEGVTATLSFNNRPHMTIVPWEAVLAVFQNGKLMESWEVQEWKVLGTQDTGYVLASKTPLPDLSKQAPTQAAPLPELDQDIANDPEMAKWFSGTVAEG